MNIARALRICRAATGYTRTELAHACHLSPSYISLLEAGKRELALDTLSTVTAVLRIEPVIFLALAADDARDVEAMSPQLRIAALRWLQSAGPLPGDVPCPLTTPT